MSFRERLLLGCACASILSLWCLEGANDTRLVEAARQQNKQSVQTLLAQHGDVNAATDDGATALLWAAHWNDLEMADLLLHAGSRADNMNQLGVTALSLACTNGSAAMVGKLLAAGANPNLALPTGETPLMTCSRSGSAEAVRALLSHGASVNAKQDQGQTALMWGIAERHPEVTRLLIAHGADVEARTREFRELMVRQDTGARLICPPPPGVNARCANADLIPKGGSTPLLFAARSGDVESARLLIAAGAKVNEAAPDGNTPLVVAAYSGHGPLAEFLLDKDASPNAAGAGYAAIHAAVLRGDLALVKALLAHGANPNAPITKGTPIRRASQDFALPDTEIGATPFILAAKFVEPEIMQALADAGANASLSMRDGTTALMAAAGLGWRAGETRRGALFAMVPPPDDDRALECAKIALRAGANINAANENGDTALHGAASEGYRNIVELLVNQGAALNAQNKKGQTPLTLATIESLAAGAYGVRDRKTTRALLIQLGAKDGARPPQAP